MKTRVTEAFGIRHPIILSGMSWISTPSMVAAVCNAGGLGILATGVYNAEQTRQAIREVRTLTDQPFGANATLYFPGAKENAQVLLDEQVPVINFSMGKGDWLVKGAHAYGGKVVASVVNEKHARSAAEYGTDALIVTANEAAAHAGECGAMVLVPAIVDAVKIPVIAAGGIADGRGLAAALALGAEGVAMGTRLMCTRESPAHERCKQQALDRSFEDTIYSKRFDGQWCRVMRAPGAERARKKGLDLPAAAINSREIAAQMGLPYVKLALGVLASGWENTKRLAFLANAFKAFRIAVEEGDENRGVLPLGQSAGLVHDIPTVAEVLERTVAEAAAVQARMAKAVA
ncbi:MAG: nitronate monooxygenase [Gemmatimonadales bacterium]|jgi:enoyl-[acyl-carrier protein] reductase II|nr:nitronate monooxygenase [Gemmatimonadales bacterium]